MVKKIRTASYLRRLTEFYESCDLELYLKTVTYFGLDIEESVEYLYYGTIDNYRREDNVCIDDLIEEYLKIYNL